MKNLERGTKIVDTFERSQTYGKVGIILDIDKEGDYWCFFIDSAKGDSLTDEEYDYLESIDVDDFGTCGYAFPDMIKLA